MYLYSWLLPTAAGGVAAIAGTNDSSSSGPIAHTRNGTYIGTSLPQLSQEIFLGIPFAHARRYEVADSLDTTWSSPKPATEFGIVCAGFGTNPRENWLVGEDCLNLNVARPTNTKPGSDLPVMVWIYGGGFRQGTNRDAEFNISYIVETSIQIEHSVVVVAINYRLSGFGFLDSDQVRAQGITNLGIRDQWKALEWIHENIQGFGGDPSKVTIWGESAGAFSVSDLLQAYGGNNDGLFHGAIMASGTSFPRLAPDGAAAQATYNNVTNATGCGGAIDTLQCLRDLPFEILNATLYGQNEGQVFEPQVDGDILRTSALTQFQKGQVAPVPIITGCNSDEGITFAQFPVNSDAELSVILQGVLKINATGAQELLDLYPIDAPAPPYSQPLSIDWVGLTAKVGLASGTQTRRAYAIVGDWIFMAGRRFTASEWEAASGHEAYSYRFDTDPSRFPLVVTAGLGPGFAQHGSELSYEFRIPYVSPTPYPPLPNVTAMQNVSYAMQATWVSFAATGSPNRHGLGWVPHWPSYGESTSNFVFNGTLDNVLNLHTEKDDFRSQGIQWLNDRWAYFGS